MAETVRLEGLEGLLDTLKSMPKELVSKRGGPVALAMRRGGNIIRDEAKRRAPVDSGFLRKQIVTRRAGMREMRKAPPGTSEYFTVGTKLGKKKKYANTKANRRKRRVGGVYETDGWAYYWRFLEFGTKSIKARPFLTPAAEAKGPEAAQVITKEIRKAIDRITKKHGWKG